MDFSPVIIAVVSSFVTLFIGWLGYISQRPKLRSEAREVAEKADDIVFSRMKDYVLQQEKRIADQEKRHDALATELQRERDSRLRDQEAARDRQRQLELALTEEKSMRQTLEREVLTQRLRIEGLEEENRSLRRTNEALAKRINTSTLSREVEE